MIEPSFKKVKAICYSQHKQGYYVYVYAKPNLCDSKVVTKYIGRYLEKPVIATSRIDRYGSLYDKHRKIDAKFDRIISKDKHIIYRSFTQRRTDILLSFGYNPLDCPEYHHKMEFLELYYGHKRVSLEETYEKATSKSHGKRSYA